MGTSMQKVASEIGSGNGVLDAINGNSGSLGNFMHQAGSDAAAGFMAQAHKGALSKTEDRLSRENQIIASTGNAENDMRTTVAKGMGARKAFDDGMGAGFMKQTETDTRAGIESQEAKSKLYSPEVQIDAARVKAAAGLTNDVGTAKGLVDSGAFDSKGGAGKEHSDYESGIGYQSRKQANQTMALGKGWSNMSEEAKSNLMGKVQTNTDVAEFGVIDATHDEIMQHGGAEQAKRDMVTMAQKKGIDATADANTLRSKFSDKKGGLESGLVTKDEQDKFDARTKDLEESIAKDAELSKMNWSPVAKTIIAQRASTKEKLLQEHLKNGPQAISLADVASANSEKQLSAQIGSAVGWRNVDNAFSKSLNAENLKTQTSLESSAQQIKGAGGIDNMIKADSLSAFEKGKSSVVSMDEKLKGASDGKVGLTSEDSSKIASALASIATAAGKADAAKSLGNMDAVENLDKLERGRGGYIGATRDEMLYNSIGTGKDMEYMESQTNGDRAKAITKADHISDMKTISSNATMSIAEDIFGSNAGAFEMLKNTAIIGGAVMALAPGAGKVGGMVLGGFDAATGKVKGKDSKGGRSAFSSENAKDVEEYLDNNKGARSATGIASKRATGMSGTAYLAEKEANQSGLSPVTSPRTTVPTTIPNAMNTPIINPPDITSPLSGNIENSIAKSLESVNSAQGATMPSFNNATFTLSNAKVELSGASGSAAPQHKGFTTLPMGHNTLGAMEQHFTTTQQQNAQAMSNISPTSRYVGFSATDADGNQVNFSTSKSSQSISCGQGLKKR